jgi:hypothetical protein
MISWLVLNDDSRMYTTGKREMTVMIARKI